MNSTIYLIFFTSLFVFFFDCFCSLLLWMKTTNCIYWTGTNQKFQFSNASPSPLQCYLLHKCQFLLLHQHRHLHHLLHNPQSKILQLLFHHLVYASFSNNFNVWTFQSRIDMCFGWYVASFQWDTTHNSPQIRTHHQCWTSTFSNFSQCHTPCWYVIAWMNDNFTLYSLSLSLSLLCVGSMTDTFLSNSLSSTSEISNTSTPWFWCFSSWYVWSITTFHPVHCSSWTLKRPVNSSINHFGHFESIFCSFSMIVFRTNWRDHYGYPNIFRRTLFCAQTCWLWSIENRSSDHSRLGQTIEKTCFSVSWNNWNKLSSRSNTVWVFFNFFVVVAILNQRLFFTLLMYAIDM